MLERGLALGCRGNFGFSVAAAQNQIPIIKKCEIVKEDVIRDRTKDGEKSKEGGNYDRTARRARHHNRGKEGTLQ